MTAPAAISGDFATYKHVQGRKIMQLVIEVPAEMASAVFAALGTPGSGEAIPVALARLTAAPEPIAKPEATKERRPFSELPYAQQAAMRCNEPDFEHFLWDRTGLGQGADAKSIDDMCVDGVVGHVRYLCGVNSRSEIIKGTPAGDKWASLEAEYWSWQRGAR